MCRDIAVLALIIFAVTQWQSRNLLEDNGSIKVRNQTLVTLDGETDTLFAESASEGKNTLIYFFAPWCNVCAFSIGNLDGLDEEKTNVVRIALDYASTNEVQKFVDNNHVEGQILLGNDELKSEFNIPGYPTYYILDSNQNIIASSMGYSSTIGLKITEFLNSQ